MSDQPSHLPPQNLEAEEAILGAMIMATSAVDAAVDAGLVATDFYRESHRLIFDAICTTISANNDRTDELLVIDALRAAGTLSKVGGPASVLSLAERCPAVANAKAYASEVIKQSNLRRLVETGHEIAKLGYEAGTRNPDELIAAAATLATNIDTTRGRDDYANINDTLGALFDEWGERAENGGVVAGLTSGLPNLDKQTGGWRGGKLIIVAGRPGMGKSGFGVQCCAHVAAHSLGTAAVFSLEMDAKEILSRLVSAAGLVDGRRLTQSHPVEGDWPSITKAMGQILDFKDRLKIAFTPQLTPALLRSRIRKLQKSLVNTAHPLKLVFIDYLQLMDPTGRRLDNQTQNMSMITRDLKKLSLEFDLPIIAASQLNRSVEARQDKRPMLSDLRESGSIEQDADSIILLMRPEYYWPDEPDHRGLAIADLAKNRGGATSQVALGWDASHTRFMPEQFNPFIAGETHRRSIA